MLSASSSLKYPEFLSFGEFMISKDATLKTPNQYTIRKGYETSNPLKIYTFKRISTVSLAKVMNYIKNTKFLSLHENLVPLTLRASRDFFFIISPFFSDGNLENLLDYENILDEKIALKYFKQIMEGLRFSHENGLFHLGLKPSNIFFDNEKIKLADFNMLELYSHSIDYYKNNMKYMAPEYLQKRIKSGKSDIWSAGIILYEMICGKTPWDGSDLSEYISNVKNIPLKLPEELSYSVKNLLKGMLNFQTETRFDLGMALSHDALKYH